MSGLTEWGRAFRAWRREAKITLSEFSDAMGVRVSEVSSWEFGRIAMSEKMRANIHRHFPQAPLPDIHNMVRRKGPAVLEAQQRIVRRVLAIRSHPECPWDPTEVQQEHGLLSALAQRLGREHKATQAVLSEVAQLLSSMGPLGWSPTANGIRRLDLTHEAWASLTARVAALIDTTDGETEK